MKKLILFVVAALTLVSVSASAQGNIGSQGYYRGSSVGATGAFSGQLLGDDGSTAGPPYSYKNSPNTGWFLSGSGVGAQLRASVNGALAGQIDAGGGWGAVTYYLGSSPSSPDLAIRRFGASLINLTDLANTTGVGLDFTVDAVIKFRTRAHTGFAQLQAESLFMNNGAGGLTSIAVSGDGKILMRDNAATNFNMLQFGCTTATCPALRKTSTQIDFILADGSAFTSAKGSVITGESRVSNEAAYVTVGSGTGVTVNTTGTLARQVYKVTVDRTAFVCAAVTCDVTIATFPTKTEVLAVYADLTQTFACTATCTSSTLSMTAGNTAGNNGFLVSFDIDAAIALFGDADAELGTLINRANAVQAGYITSFGSTTPLSIRLTSGTGNIGNGSATNLSQGSLTFYVVTERLP